MKLHLLCLTYQLACYQEDHPLVICQFRLLIQRLPQVFQEDNLQLVSYLANNKLMFVMLINLFT